MEGVRRIIGQRLKDGSVVFSGVSSLGLTSTRAVIHELRVSRDPVLGVGSVTSGTCMLLANAFTTAQASATAQLSGSSVTAGTYCVQVSDVSNQLGPVSYAVAVSHY